MAITPKFKEIIEDDIDLCEDLIRGYYQDQLAEVHHRLPSKYDQIIPSFSEGLRGVFHDEDDIKRDNIKTMKEKLEVYLAGGYEKPESIVATPTAPLINFNNSNTNNNSNSNNISINVTFPEVKQQIENMSALSETEIAEILKKITELESIVNSSQRKGQKWEKAKGIIHWIADKGVDVGIALLPLLLKIQ